MKSWRIFAIFAALATVVAGGFAMLPAFAANPMIVDNSIETICASNPSSSICGGGANADIRNSHGLNTTFQTIINILLSVAGIIAVVMIIISAIRFVSSRGDAGAVEKSRHTLTYSIAGLVVVILAFSIVNFVLASLL